MLQQAVDRRGVEEIGVVLEGHGEPGLVLDHGTFLTPAEAAQMRCVPELVFELPAEALERWPPAVERLQHDGGALGGVGWAPARLARQSRAHSRRDTRGHRGDDRRLARCVQA